MYSLVICGFLGFGALAAGDNSPADQQGLAWLKDFAQAKARALSAKKPIFAVFR
jgi:hypothetical protein